MNLEAFAKSIINIFKFHKLKILTFFLSTLFFLFALFPFNDLSDYISSIITQGTQNKVFVQFEKMGISFFPTPGVEMESVSIDTPNLSTIESDSLSIHPSIPAILSFKAGGTAYAKGFMGGDATVFGKVLESTPEGAKLNIDINSEGLLIKKLSELLPVQGNLKGTLDFTSTGTYDLSFKEQPTASLQAKIGAFQLLSLSIPTQMGPFPLPRLSLKEVIAKMRMEGGKLIIEELNLGQKGDPLEANIEGQVNVNFRNVAGRIRPILGAYDLSVDMSMQTALENQMAVLVNVLSLNRYKRGDKYSFRASGTPTTAPKIRAK